MTGIQGEEAVAGTYPIITFVGSRAEDSRQPYGSWYTGNMASSGGGVLQQCVAAPCMQGRCHAVRWEVLGLCPLALVFKTCTAAKASTQLLLCGFPSHML